MGEKTDWQERLLVTAMGVVLAMSMLAIAKEAAVYTVPAAKEEDAAVLVSSGRAVADKREKERFHVVIDAGHGGLDPGKVGINGAKEKEINLQIALMLADFLEAGDVEVTLTRADENGLYDEDAPNKKVQDMKRRIGLIEEAAPALTVSIHQNSYPEEYVHGAQVFYYKDSAVGQALAERLQLRLKNDLDPDNKRQVKPNDTYYLLKKTPTPIVIVECGFLSNRGEAQKLCDAYYQEKLAWSIHLGILQYLNTQG